MFGVAPKPADKPGSVAGGHLSGTTVTRRLTQPTRGSNETGRLAPPKRTCPCLALLPVGVAWPPASPRTPVVSYTTFSPSPGQPRLPRLSTFLWPFSVGLPRLGVTQHRALWSPDFPRLPREARSPGRLGRRRHDNTWTVAVKDRCDYAAAPTGVHGVAFRPTSDAGDSTGCVQVSTSWCALPTTALSFTKWGT